jgi:hypothetical protein
VRARVVIVLIAWIVGVACILVGVGLCSESALGWLIGVPAILVGALFISVSVAWAITRPAPGTREEPRNRPAELPRATVRDTHDDPPWVRGLANRDGRDDGGDPRS